MTSGDEEDEERELGEDRVGQAGSEGGSLHVVNWYQGQLVLDTEILGVVCADNKGTLHNKYCPGSRYYGPENHFRFMHKTSAS